MFGWLAFFTILISFFHSSSLGEAVSNAKITVYNPPPFSLLCSPPPPPLSSLVRNIIPYLALLTYLLEKNQPTSKLKEGNLDKDKRKNVGFMERCVI